MFGHLLVLNQSTPCNHGLHSNSPVPFWWKMERKRNRQGNNVDQNPCQGDATTRKAGNIVRYFFVLLEICVRRVKATDSVLWPTRGYAYLLYEMTGAFSTKKDHNVFLFSVWQLPSSYPELKGFGTIVIISGRWHPSCNKLSAFIEKKRWRLGWGGWNKSAC